MRLSKAFDPWREKGYTFLTFFMSTECLPSLFFAFWKVKIDQDTCGQVVYLQRGFCKCTMHNGMPKSIKGMHNDVIVPALFCYSRSV